MEHRSRAQTPSQMNKKAQQSQYRAELEQQIREKEARKAATKARDEESHFGDTPSHKTFPWENTIGRYAGGGGDPVRDELGNIITNLKEVLSAEETRGRNRGQFIQEMNGVRQSKSGNHSKSGTPRANSYGNDFYAGSPTSENGGRVGSRGGGSSSSSPMNYDYPPQGRDYGVGSPMAASPVHRSKSVPEAGIDPYYQGYPPPPVHSSTPTGSPHHPMRQSRVTRLDSGMDQDTAVITFTKGSRVATFKVDGMQVEQFEDLLDMWSRHREAHQ
eukprot:CAMPEP_0117672290 /NCGR_PEP_ID=MMETSP0804-20121206/13817_1 /TAXON_ID=1074897 /ORGANISM="Tetraselmis astigmatica, Strain CCMP880" /LENGTH=272 /DNA_ID=CAMNT_0005480865 /DNA_START=241 /DNA_END=1059 /DNA_ORIENTATION=+